MEAEKLFIEGIKEDKFFYIDNFEDGISCNLFSKQYHEFYCFSAVFFNAVN